MLAVLAGTVTVILFLYIYVRQVYESLPIICNVMQLQEPLGLQFGLAFAMCALFTLELDWLSSWRGKYVIVAIFLVLSVIIQDIKTGCSAAVARFVRDEEVASSILATPTTGLFMIFLNS